MCPRRWLCVLALFATLAPPPPVRAINIVLNFNAGASDPYLDPDTSANRTNELIAIMESVALKYEDMIEDTHTLTINYWWDNLTDPTVGLHNNITTVGGRETECNIRFDTTIDSSGDSRRWFIDPTPEDHSEYLMGSTLYRDLTATQQSDWYNGAPNAVLESGFRGVDAPGAPFDAVNGLDLLTVAFHEVGHALGLTGSVASGETGVDFDYDVSSSQVDGNVMAVECAASDNQFHLDGNFMMMFPSVSGGLRTLPSASDMLALASASNWTDLDLDRKYFNQSGDWNTAGNWIGGDFPDVTEDAFLVDTNSEVSLSAAGGAANLVVSDGADLNTLANFLNVPGQTTVSGAGSQIIIRPDGELQTGSLRLENGGELDVEGGLADINGNLVIADATSSITGRDGIIDVEGTLNNNGIILPDLSAELTFTTAAGSFNLDGTGENGVVDASANSLVFDGPLTDGFNGLMVVGSGESITLVDGWTLNNGGDLDLEGSAAEIAAISGGLSIINGDVDVTGLAAFNSAVTFQSSANVSVPAAAQLSLENAINYSGGTFTGAGEVQQDATATVASATTISVATYDWDGNSGLETTTLVANGGHLTLNVTNVDDGGNVFNGTINSNLFATLTVNTPAPWTMAGTLNVEGDPADNLIYLAVAGSPVTLAGTTNVDGAADFSADVTVTGTVNTADALATMRFAGGQDHRIQGGVINGPGRIGITATSTLSGFGTIDADVNAQSGSELLAQNGTLTLSGAILNAGVIGTADNSGTLSVSSAWNTSAADELRLNGGSVLGAAITNDGVTRGRGILSPASFINNGTLSADFGGTLVVQPATFPDLDGSGTEDGIINANLGDILVTGDFGGLFLFNATLNVQGGQFEMDHFGLQVGGNGVVNFSGAAGGVYQAPQLVMGSGSQLITSVGAGELHSANQFQSGSTATLNGPLELHGDTTIALGATMTGSSFLQVESGVTLMGNATLGVDLVNHGAVNPGLSPGVLTLGDFTQSASGSLVAEIAGLTAGAQYDVLQANGVANLDGVLDVDLLAFVPSAGNVFQVLRYSSRVGVFDSIVDQIFGAGAGQFFWPVYGTDHLSLYVPLAGDANFDGVVDGADFTIWADNFGSGTEWAEADFTGDGLVDGADFTVWADNFGASAPLDALAPIPEPGTLALAGAALAAIGVLQASRRRRRDHDRRQAR